MIIDISRGVKLWGLDDDPFEAAKKNAVIQDETASASNSVHQRADRVNSIISSKRSYIQHTRPPQNLHKVS